MDCTLLRHGRQKLACNSALGGLRLHRKATFFTSIARYPCKVNTFPAFLRTFAQTANLIF